MRECHEYIDLLTAQLDSQISEAEERELFEHLLACPECRMIQEDLLELSDTMSEMQIAPPTDLSERIMSAVATEKKAKIIPFYKRKNFLSSVITAAAMFAILVVAGTNLNHLLGSSTAPMPAAAMPETTQAESANLFTNESESRQAVTDSGNGATAQDSSPYLATLDPVAGRAAPGNDAATDGDTVADEAPIIVVPTSAPAPAAPKLFIEPEVTPEVGISPSTYSLPIDMPVDPMVEPAPPTPAVEPTPEPLPVTSPEPEEPTPTPAPEVPLLVGELTFHLIELPLPAFLAEIGVPEPEEGLEIYRLELTDSEYQIIELQFIANDLAYTSVAEGPSFSSSGTIGVVNIIYAVELPQITEEPEIP